MGLLDGIFGNFLRADPAQNPLLQVALQLLQQNGGLQQLLVKCQNAGYGPQMQSWISSAQNMPIESSALAQIFGADQIREIAAKLGLPHDQVAGGLAQSLPQVVDQLTPQGHIPDGHADVVAELLQRLRQQAG